ncbi:MAG: HAD-IB family phosphatase [Actinobacteria bacterium]|nr:HAD-IB family phosphatase [Actinomycetota bacterium]
MHVRVLLGEEIRDFLSELSGFEVSGELVNVREHVRIRRGFRELVELARERGWGFEVVSSGFHELIEPVLEREGVAVDLHANRVDARPEGWRVLWHYGADCGSCGESCKRAVAAELAGEGELVYVGDGYSDRCAAELADRVFARRGLAVYLEERGVPYERFDDFHDVIRGLDDAR